MFQFSGFALRFASEFQVFNLEGCPIRKPADIMDICSSPQLIAACHGLLRLATPRHPPMDPYSLDHIIILAQKPQVFELESIHFVNWSWPNAAFAFDRL